MFFWVFWLFLLGGFVVFYYHLHYMVVLLGLEVMLFSLFMGMSIVCLKFMVSYGSFLYLLVLVCMGGFGVSLLVSVSRSLGKDFWFMGCVE